MNFDAEATNLSRALQATEVEWLCSYGNCTSTSPFYRCRRGINL